ncbi:uncharacterized protein LOC126380364 isoform X1 [Pectinophora gossypiella]|uniref:BED-type domain-containing protein n=1 Tax=Pectinophora gossypiella TaxID=13191 RepID=A0A1E1WRL1_PECGO|nr:uncharacterized protein LOC126380364 isoform X1 [Pectinophora gossypiella]
MKKVSSVVWQFFDRLEENKRCVAVLCKLCDSEYKYFGNTTNLRAHLIKKHPIQWEFRQNNLDNTQKTLEETVVHTFEEDDNTNQSTNSPKRRKYVRATAKDQNVRYALSIKHIDSDTAGEDAVPQIEIQRVDVQENSETETEHVDEDVATLNLVRQMHDNQGSDEEWLEDDYIQLDRYEPAKRKRSYRKIKREVVTPPRKTPYHAQSVTKTPRRTERIVIEDPKKDEYSVFGEYIANKLRKFKAPRTRGNIQQIITTILWQAEYGLYDDAEAVKRVLMLSTAQYGEEEQQSTSQINEMQMQTDQYTLEKGHEDGVQTIESG